VSGEPLHSVGDAFAVHEGADGREFRCARCSHHYGPVTADPKLSAVVAERAITEISELNRHGAVDELVLREYYCPGCGLMVAANVQRRGDPVLREIELD